MREIDKSGPQIIHEQLFLPALYEALIKLSAMRPRGIDK